MMMVTQNDNNSISFQEFQIKTRYYIFTSTIVGLSKLVILP